MNNLGNFPSTRLRRTRCHAWCRRLVAEHKLSTDDLILPVFIHDGDEAEVPINSMPNVNRVSVQKLLDICGNAKNLGIPAIALFPAIEPSKKTPAGDEATNPENIVCNAIRAVKAQFPEMGIICDAALDPFTDHGHDGILDPTTGIVLNDETVSILCRQALVQAEAGCDVIAPSDMMDGRIAAIRKALEAAGYQNVLILSYAAKYASSFYGPFRDAIGSAALSGLDKARGFRDKKSYQMDPANAAESLREVLFDIQEGADIVMVKPALPYLDIISKVKQEFDVPTFAYQVSGEYAMIKFAAQHGAIDEKRAFMESLLAMKRAGADAILTYAALQVSNWIREEAGT